MSRIFGDKKEFPGTVLGSRGGRKEMIG